MFAYCGKFGKNQTSLLRSSNTPFFFFFTVLFCFVSYMCSILFASETVCLYGDYVCLFVQIALTVYTSERYVLHPFELETPMLTRDTNHSHAEFNCVRNTMN